jgi:hypothetical protein
MTGWECPKCGRCFAPHVDQCVACGIVTHTSPTPGTTTYHPVCSKCGFSVYTPPGTGCSTPWVHVVYSHTTTTTNGPHPQGTK